MPGNQALPSPHRCILACEHILSQSLDFHDVIELLHFTDNTSLGVAWPLRKASGTPDCKQGCSGARPSSRMMNNRI